MEPQSAFNVAATLFGFLGGWILRIIWSEIKLMQENQKEIERDLSDHYVKKDDYRLDIAEIKGILGRIFDKLDRQ